MLIAGLLLDLIGALLVAAGLLVQPPLPCHLPRLLDASEPMPAYCGRSLGEIDDLTALYESQRAGVEERIAAAEAEWAAHIGELTARDRVERREAILEEPPALQEVRRELAGLELELTSLARARRLRAIPVWPIGVALMAVGSGLMVLGLRRRNGGNVGNGRMPAAFARAAAVEEVVRTVTVDQAERILPSLLKRRADALAEMWALRPRTCAYCSKPLPPTPAGRLVHERLLKAAPGDVKVKREIPLGEGWTFVPPEQIPCAACGHANRLQASGR
jgi:hypothetical protein